MNAEAEMLRALLVHLFFVDLDLDRREMDILARVMPDGDVREHVTSAAARPLDLNRRTDDIGALVV